MDLYFTGPDDIDHRDLAWFQAHPGEIEFVRDPYPDEFLCNPGGKAIFLRRGSGAKIYVWRIDEMIHDRIPLTAGDAEQFWAETGGPRDA